MKTFEIIALDVWGNEDDGYTVNDSIHTGNFITLPDDYTKQDIIKKCFDEDVTITIEDDGFMAIYVDREKDGRPLLELRYTH